MDARDRFSRRASLPKRPPWPTVTSELQSGRDAERQQLFHAIGCIAARWNSAERSFRLLLTCVCKLNSISARILLTHMQSKGMQDALTAAAKHLGHSPDITEAILHSERLFERNRINRNFVIHNSYDGATSPNSEQLRLAGTEGFILEVTKARGRISQTQWLVTLEALRKTADEIYELDCYLAGLLDCFLTVKGGSLLPPPPKPTFPDDLSTSRTVSDLVRQEMAAQQEDRLAE